MIGRDRLLRFGGPGAPLVCGALYLGLMMSSVVWAQQNPAFFIGGGGKR
jgi:hypothetical protein